MPMYSALIIIHELKKALELPDPSPYRTQLIQIFKSLLTKHDYDSVYQSRESKAQLAKTYSQILTFYTIPEDKHERLAYFLCVLWVMKNMNYSDIKDVYMGSLSSLNQTRLFFSLIQSCILSLSSMPELCDGGDTNPNHTGLRIQTRSLESNQKKELAVDPNAPISESSPPQTRSNSPMDGNVLVIESALIMLKILHIYIKEVAPKTKLPFVNSIIDILLAVMQLEKCYKVTTAAASCWQALIPYYYEDLFKKVRGQEKLRQSAVEILRICSHPNPSIRSKGIGLIYLISQQNYKYMNSTKVFSDACKAALLQHVFVEYMKNYQRMEVTIASAIRYLCSLIVSSSEKKDITDSMILIFLGLQEIVGKASELEKITSSMTDPASIMVKYHRFFQDCCEKYPELDLSWMEDYVLNQYSPSKRFSRPLSSPIETRVFRKLNYPELIRMGFRLMLKHEMGKPRHMRSSSGTEQARTHNRTPSSEQSRAPQRDSSIPPVPKSETMATARSSNTAISSQEPQHPRSSNRLTPPPGPTQTSPRFTGAEFEELDWTPHLPLSDPSSTDPNFHFKIYYAAPFQLLRDVWGYNKSEFILAMCASKYLREWKNPGGKSGSLMLYSSDNRLVVKSMSSDESHLLREIIRDYVKHMLENPNTLLIRILGIFSFKCIPHQRIHFVIMENVMPAKLRISEKYDLKGSRVGRLVNPIEENGVVPVLKDMNVKEKFRFGDEMRKHFLEQLDIDTTFLYQYQIIDYSLLLGIHRIALDPERPDGHSSLNMDTNYLETITCSQKPNSRGNISIFRSYEGGFLSPVLHKTEGEVNPSLQPSDGKEQTCSASYMNVYYVGVIDILQQYNFKKQMELNLKGLIYEKEELSVQEPTTYRQRFLKFLEEFTE